MTHPRAFAALAALSLSLPSRSRAVLAGMALACCLSANAGPWEVAAPGGLQWRIVEDSTRTRDGYLLERRYADGRLDTQFGNAGVVVFALGADNEGPAALRVDAAGRAWIVGASQGADGLRAVVMRFTNNGLPDTLFARDGRAAVAPAGAQARALDLLPLDDGSAWVAGSIVDGAGQERSGAWRLRVDGSVDPRFGLGGLWQDEAGGATELSGVQRAPDGSVALGLRRRADGRAWLETWVWQPEAALPQAASRLAVDATAMGRAHLVWRDRRWQWVDPAGLAVAGVASPRDVAIETHVASRAGTQVVASAATAAASAGSVASPASAGHVGEPLRGRWAVWLLVAALAALALAATWFGLRRGFVHRKR